MCAANAEQPSRFRPCKGYESSSKPPRIAAWLFLERRIRRQVPIALGTSPSRPPMLALPWLAHSGFGHCDQRHSLLTSPDRVKDDDFAGRTLAGKPPSNFMVNLATGV